MINSSVTVEGILPEDSLRAFKDSYNRSSQMFHYQEYEDELKEMFTQRIKENIRDNNIDVEGLADSFSIDITSNSIEFKSSMGKLADKYEYGVDGIVGRRFMEPAVIDVGNFISEKMVDNATSSYQQNTAYRSKNIDSYIDNSQNEYAYMLK